MTRIHTDIAGMISDSTNALSLLRVASLTTERRGIKGAWSAVGELVPDLFHVERVVLAF